MRNRREENNLSLSDIARQISYTKAGLSLIEVGQRFPQKYEEVISAYGFNNKEADFLQGYVQGKSLSELYNEGEFSNEELKGLFNIIITIIANLSELHNIEGTIIKVLPLPERARLANKVMTALLAKANKEAFSEEETSIFDNCMRIFIEFRESSSVFEKKD